MRLHREIHAIDEVPQKATVDATDEVPRTGFAFDRGCIPCSCVTKVAASVGHSFIAGRFMLRDKGRS